MTFRNNSDRPTRFAGVLAEETRWLEESRVSRLVKSNEKDPE